MHKMRHCGNAQKQRFLTPANNTVPWGQKRSGSGSGRNNWLYPIEEREEHRALNDSLGSHTPPPPAARRGSSAVHPPPLRCAHGSETAPSCAESATHGHARRSGCVLLRGSGQPAPPTCRSRLRSAGCAVCPSRRFAYTASALGTACRESDVRRAGRFLAAARTPLRQVGCCPLALVRGWWWGVGSACSRPGRAREGRTGLGGRRRAPARPPRSRSIPSRLPAAADRARTPAGAPTPTASRHRPTRPRRSAPSPRPRRTTWSGTPSPV